MQAEINVSAPMMYSDGVSTVLSFFISEKPAKKGIEGNGDKIAVYVGSSPNVLYLLLFVPKILTE